MFPMDNKELLQQNIAQSLKKLGLDLDASKIIIQNSKDVSHGDYATNVAMQNARLLQTNPLEAAKQIIANLDLSNIEKVEIAGPGFINFYMKKDSLTGVISQIIKEDENFGRGEKKNKKINIEFVSANPTGDLHVGHARGAAIGDSIARIMEFDGYDVTREYYINDAGNQIDHLAESILERLKEALGLPFELPSDGYHGEDVKIVALKIKDKLGEKHILDNLEKKEFIE